MKVRLAAPANSGDGMTPEMIAVVGVGVALAGLILSGQRSVNVRMDRIDARMDRIDARMDRLEGRMDRLESGQAELRERMAHLEGLLEGLREAIVHRAAA